jgi:hypothetical protein
MRPPRRGALLLAALAAFALATPGAASAISPDPADVLLRLADLGPGYRLFFSYSDGCEPITIERTSIDPVVHAIGSFRHRGCSLEFARAWAAPGAPTPPRQVIAAAFVFDRVEGAEAALAHPRVVASETFDPAPYSFTLVDPAPALGDEAVRLRLDDGRAVLVWRSGATVGLVLAGGRRAAANDATILRLAAAEQARIAAPTPLRRSDNDDSEVPLDNPDLRGPVHWLGKRLPAQGRLPGLRLADSIRADRSGARQGFRALLLYRSRAGRSAVTLVLEPPSTLRQAALRRQLRRIRREACTRFERIPLSGGRASIYALAPHCGSADEQTPLAIARFPHAAVIVSLSCARCGPLARYGTRAGLRRLVHALRVRPPAFPRPS